VLTSSCAVSCAQCAQCTDIRNPLTGVRRQSSGGCLESSPPQSDSQTAARTTIRQTATRRRMRKCRLAILTTRRLFVFTSTHRCAVASAQPCLGSDWECATQVVSYSELLECFWSCHDSTITAWHRQNGTVSSSPEHNPRIWQYRSAIFTHSTEQAQLAAVAITEHLKTVPVSASANRVVSSVPSAAPCGRSVLRCWMQKSLSYTEPARKFHAAESYHQKYLLQQQPEIFAASGLESRASELMHSRLACKLNGFVGASATPAERAALVQEVIELCDPQSAEAFGMGRQPDLDRLRHLLSEFRLGKSGTLVPQPRPKL
jgi:peptide methionine sulfoxide reductase MsrA